MSTVYNVTTQAAAASVRAAAQAFIPSALDALRRHRLFPRPRSNPFIAVGIDYDGSVLVQPAYKVLHGAIRTAHSRFDDDSPTNIRQYPQVLIYSFIEACVARLSVSANPQDLTGEAIERSIDELVEAVLAAEADVACCRVVRHLTTSSGDALTLCGFDITPISAQPEDHRQAVESAAERAIPGSRQVIRREGHLSWTPPESFVSARLTASDPHNGILDASRALDDALLMLQLLHGSTAHAAYEVRGGTRLVSELRPELLHVGEGLAPGPFTALIRRDAIVDASDEQRLLGLHQMLTSAREGRQELIVDPFSLAVHRFQRSFLTPSLFDQTLDLMTGLEAAMSGEGKNDVLLRLRNRSAALLAADNDGPEVIFHDVGILYDVRSVLIHGGQMKTKRLAGRLASLSSVPPDTPLVEAFAHAIDRLRDLLRRAILARLCLSTGETPLWPLDSDPDLDALLTDDERRREWRASWHKTLGSIGALEATRRPPAAVSYLLSLRDLERPTREDGR